MTSGIKINGCIFTQMSGIPETYDVSTEDGKHIGVMKVTRRKVFGDIGHWGGKTVFSADTKEDGYLTMSEKMSVLRAAADAYNKAIGRD